MTDFIPHQDDALNIWLANFKAKITGYADGFGIAPADLTDYLDKCDALSAAVIEANTFRQQYGNRVKSKNMLRTKTLATLRTLIARIKTDPAYTPAIGTDLGIIASAEYTDFSILKPELIASASGGQILITFKRGHTNGIRLYSARGPEAAFSFLALDTHSPYHDTRGNLAPGTPEVRRYYAYYIDNADEQVGLQSDIVSITV